MPEPRTLKVIGRIRGKSLADLQAWIELQPVDRLCHSQYAPERLERWYGIGSNLQSINMGRHKLFEAAAVPPRVFDLGNRLYPDWHSILLCGGKTDIDWHFDHGCFEAKAVMVNLGEALYRECHQHEGYKPIAWHEHYLTDGEVVEIDTKLLHSAQQLSLERFNLTFRRFKPQFLQEFTQCQNLGL